LVFTGWYLTVGIYRLVFYSWYLPASIIGWYLPEFAGIYLASITTFYDPNRFLIISQNLIQIPSFGSAGH
jgi:hypothetical protein